MQNGCGTWKEYPQIEYFSHSNWGLFQHIHHLKAATFPRLAEVQVLLRCQLGIAPEPQTWHHLLRPCEISGCSIWGIRGLSGRCCPARKHPRGPSAKAVLERSLAGNARGASHSPCRTARWWGDKQPRCSQTGSPRFCLYPAASRWPVFWFSNAYGTAKSREHLSDDAKSPACDVLHWNVLIGFLSYWSLLQHWPLLSEYKYWKDKNPNPNNTKVRQLLGKIISPWYL